MKAKLALLAALVLAILAALAVRQFVQDKERAIFASQKPVSILVAARNIDEGEVVTGPSLMIKEYPRSFLPPDAITANDRATVTGKKATRNIRGDDPIQWSDLLDKNREKEEGLQALLAVGERAMTISVTKTSGVGGMIRPGDRVDIYATFRQKDDNHPEGFKIFTNQVLRSVLVLATGQKINKADVPGSQRRFGDENKEDSFSAMTLSLTPLEAGIVLHARQTGGLLTMTLRNREDIVDMERIPEVNSDTFWNTVKDADTARQERLNKLRHGGDDLDAGL
ncbi:MAG: Flp pilus assembly protein CpaB [Planctomycetota bacterium]|nr:Flp pilus assembly protein CpaB [Planctomycetota bacterium]MDA1137913.1 Flp pilus assembly protein CpaB [Planctomycetota bacterium]